MPDKKTIILMSRGKRIARFFKEAALDLKEDYNVIVFINKEEEKLWRDTQGIQIIFSHDAFIQEAEKEGRNLQNAAKEIEKEIDFPLFKSAGNYLLYRKFTKRNLSIWRKWVIDDEALLLKYYVGSYKILSRLIKENNVALIFYEMPDLIENRVALKLAYKNKIFALGRSIAYFRGKMFLTYGLSCRSPLLEYYYNNKNLISPDSFRLAEEMIMNLNKPNWFPEEIEKFRKVTKDFLNWKTFFFRAVFKLLYGFITLQPRKYFTIILNLIWLNKHSYKEIPRDRYIAFFLHQQPEASTCCIVPRWVNQENVIEQLAVNCPSDLKILIKEHIVNYGIRGKKYFKEVCELPNVYLCSCTIPSKEIILKSEIVLALSGRVGFEAILLGKKVAVLGTPFYYIYKDVKLLRYPEEIFSILEDHSSNPEVMTEERLVFAAAFIQSLYDFGCGKNGTLWPKTGGDKWAYALRDFIKKAHEYKLTPDMFQEKLP